MKDVSDCAKNPFQKFHPKRFKNRPSPPSPSAIPRGKSKGSNNLSPCANCLKLEHKNSRLELKFLNLIYQQKKHETQNS